MLWEELKEGKDNVEKYHKRKRLWFTEFNSSGTAYLRIRVLMATTACFIIVSRNDIPIYEAEVGSAAKREDAAQLHQFILHAALDIVQDIAWTTSAMFLKAIDRFNDLVVSVYVTAGHILSTCG
ncbi:hypothetical protein CMV_008302 [Castanea mollissima]|uniref:Trafficking protein particle complex subunit 2 n=2 Tax=Fagaceae TaxID=3503 RepID=A0A8J4R7M5_9ROSI|nr:hypothetical protein CMV_008302 [Castanea mollissima]